MAQQRERRKNVRAYNAAFVGKDETPAACSQLFGNEDSSIYGPNPQLLMGQWFIWSPIGRVLENEK